MDRSVFINQVPPVWVDVDVSYIPIMKKVNSYAERSFGKAQQCINLLAEALKVASFSPQ
jgi:hypothetical protein